MKLLIRWRRKYIKLSEAAGHMMISTTKGIRYIYSYIHRLRNYIRLGVIYISKKGEEK